MTEIVTVVNAKGGCGKTAIAMNLGAALAKRSNVLMLDMDPQAQLSTWLGAGDGVVRAGTLAAVFLEEEELEDVIQRTKIPRLYIVPSAGALETVSHDMARADNGEFLLADALATLPKGKFDYIVVDSPNQISPLMMNGLAPSDVIVVPFEGAQAVESYADLDALIRSLREEGTYKVLHVLNKLKRNAFDRKGPRKRVVEKMRSLGLPRAKSEVRDCGWLAQVSEEGGSIFHYRPDSNGAADLTKLTEEVLKELAKLSSPKTEKAANG